MSSSVHIDNKEKGILIYGKWPNQGLNHTLAAETQCSINFTRSSIAFCLSLHYNGNNSFLFVNESFQSKWLWNKKIFLMFRKYFRRFFS